MAFPSTYTYARAAVLFVMLGSMLAPARLLRSQQTTTNCTTTSNTTNCTSNTTDYSAQQQRAYEQGQKFGNALGTGISNAMQAHSFNKGLRKYCDAHPGEVWHYGAVRTGQVYSSGRCPTDEDKAVMAANAFMARHHSYVPQEQNSQVMTDYIQQHRLDPREVKTYERAYKDLKKSGKLNLYAK